MVQQKYKATLTPTLPAITKMYKKLRGLSPRANFTDRVTAACLQN
jgi:hypothetical protein